MKLLSAQQIREWDQYTITHEPITSINLMERAALACVNWMNEKGCCGNSIKIFSGKGNNGGDGLAIARILMEEGYLPLLYILESGVAGSPDFETNLQRLPPTAIIYYLHPDDPFPLIGESEWVIDALFGSGLNRPLASLAAGLVQHINQSKAQIISIDIPSGMAIDSSCKNNSVIRASHTLSFQSLKRCFLMPENADYFGEVAVLDIGLDKQFTESLDTDFQIISRELIRSMIQPRKPFSHKGNYGHALLIAGNKGKMGAAVLASKACLRSGVGLLTVNIPEASFSVIHIAIAEAMVMAREKNMESPDIYKAIGMGPGMGVDNDSEKIVRQILSNFPRPVVIDADALTILSRYTDWLLSIPPGSVLTPHPKEFDRVFGDCNNDFERADKAIALSKQYPFIVVLKGHYTLIAANGKGWYNQTGNAGMAKGGSGDILTGIITALLAQSYIPLHAALIGVYLHGLAGDIALENQSMESLLGTDIIEMLGKAFEKIQK